LVNEPKQFTVVDKSEVELFNMKKQERLGGNISLSEIEQNNLGSKELKLILTGSKVISELKKLSESRNQIEK